MTDAVLFDCDGVLIDSHASYDRAIEMTLAYFLSRIFGLEMNPRLPVSKFVEYLRGTGHFNNDIDTTAAILVSILVSLRSHSTSGLKASVGGQTLDEKSDSTKASVEELREAFDSEAFAKSVLTVLEIASQGFVKFVRAVKSANPRMAPRIDELLERLSYPSSPSTSLLCRVFNEYYYGRTLLRQLYGLAPLVGRETGLIDAEKVIVCADALETLSTKLQNGRIGIVSGRSRLGTEYTLGGLVTFFQDGPMIFLEDEEANPTPGQPFLGKPDPKSLLQAAAFLGSSNGILYVGDSAEDLLMTLNANLKSSTFSFCGVVETANSPSRASMFAERGADAILESANDLPALLSSIR
mgnify:CR=1 FL=1